MESLGAVVSVAFVLCSIPGGYCFVVVLFLLFFCRAY